MHSRLFLSSLAAFLASDILALAAQDHSLHEHRDFDHPEWHRVSPAQADAIVPVRIGMVQQNIDRLDELLVEVTDPESPKYGKHYNQDEVIDLFAPHEGAVTAIRTWVEAAGIDKDHLTQSANKQWMQFDTTIAELENLLKTKFNFYELQDGKQHLACEEYHVPSHISHHIDYITPGVKLLPFHLTKSKITLQKRSSKKQNDRHHAVVGAPHYIKPLPKSVSHPEEKARAGDLKICSAISTPACIKALYNVTKPSTTFSGKAIAVYEGFDDHYSQEDLNRFFKAIEPDIPQRTHPILNGIDGGRGPTDVKHAGIESSIDFQAVYPLVYPADVVLFSEDDEPYQKSLSNAGFLNNMFDAIDGSYCKYNPYHTNLPPKIDAHYPHNVKGGYKGKLQCGKYKSPPVISISYGVVEFALPAKYMKRQCKEMAKLGMQGISIISSSGDWGVAGRPFYPSPNGCIRRDLRYSARKNGTIFAPQSPASCPYITSVGSTVLPSGADVNADEEVATVDFGSGGGFSNIYPPASYQKETLENYFRKNPPEYPFYKTFKHSEIGHNGGRFNRIGRGYPDVAANGENFLCYYRGMTIAAFGTSVSAPIFASLIARINMERGAQGKGPVGFVNPVLYKHPQVMHDIIKGRNPGCGTRGFAAVEGWDPVTGLGTPNYPKLLALFKSLP